MNNLEKRNHIEFKNKNNNLKKIQIIKILIN